MEKKKKETNAARAQESAEWIRLWAHVCVRIRMQIPLTKQRRWQQDGRCSNGENNNELEVFRVQLRINGRRFASFRPMAKKGKRINRQNVHQPK